MITINHIYNYVKSVVDDVEEIVPINQNGGSPRQYYRIYRKNKETLVVAHSSNIQENMAFFHFSEVFSKEGINVPEIVAISDDKTMYILSDLGDTTLFSLLTARTDYYLSPVVKNLCCKALENLVKMQFGTFGIIDYSFAYPIANFDETALLWDLNYFKYCLLKPSGIDFNEADLETDFQSIIKQILNNVTLTSFVYRDFQSRNIMVDEDGNLSFIDYQGGRKGVCVYDLASFISQAKANYSEKDKAFFIDYYFELIREYVTISKNEFCKVLNIIVLHRVMQTLGAYGFRGLIERKKHFIDSLKPAVANLESALNRVKESYDNELQLNEIERVVLSLKDKYLKDETTENCSDELTVTINSFSYKLNSLPTDKSNGGGFIFDCRALPNPYRINELRPLSGNTQEIKTYMDSKPETNLFFENVSNIVCMTVDNYLERKFNNLMVSFGCTGGKHRSVYNAERLAKYLRDKYENIRIVVNHLNSQNW